METVAQHSAGDTVPESQNGSAGVSVLVNRMARLGTVLFCLAFACYLVDMLLEISDVADLLPEGLTKTSIRLVPRRIGIALLVAKAALAQRAKPGQWIAALLLALLGWITWTVSTNGRCFWVFMFVATGQGVRLRDLARTSLIVLVPWFAIIVGLWAAGLIEGVTAYRPDGTARYSLGFGNPNSLGLVLLAICTSVCALRFDRRPGFELALIAGAVAVSVLVANSRTSAAVLCFEAALRVCFWLLASDRAANERSAHHRERARRAVTVCLAALVLAGIAFSYGCMVFYTEDNALMLKLNTLLTDRLMLPNQFFEEYSIWPFGYDYSTAPVLSSNGTRLAVDNAYCHYILRFGVVASVVLVAGIAWFFARAVRRGRWDVCLFGMAVYLVFGLAEVNGLVFCYNYFLIALSELLFDTPLLGGRLCSLPELVVDLSHVRRNDA